ncbi:hypothetical protein [Corallococcus carmarthensis]|uniref:Uncharacterized protein n=1 Tax=Corallococcus carmarthensis TaxID=2316728 RepID=A0A3A8JVH8_9BACT|nr:hypothetical protein [Corallococcus carmarthensis]RKG99205.1 hypothetical protein D7X32_27135 [Corallococcus carmarthensis]
MLLGHRLKQRFGLARLLGVNDRGQEDFSAPTVHACRYEGSTKRLVTSDGTDATSEAMLFTKVKVEPGDALWLPGDTPGDLNTRRRPLRITPCTDIRGGTDHYEVYV